jgi:hypothetical protein
MSAAPSAPVPAAPLPILAAAMQVADEGHDTPGNDWAHARGRSGATACRLHLTPFQCSASGRKFSSLAGLGVLIPTATQSVVDGQETLMKSEATTACVPEPARSTGCSTCQTDPVRVAAAASSPRAPTTMQSREVGQLTELRIHVLAMVAGSLISCHWAARCAGWGSPDAAADAHAPHAPSSIRPARPEAINFHRRRWAQVRDATVVLDATVASLFSGSLWPRAPTY